MNLNYMEASSLHRKKLLEVLDAFVVVCKDCNLTYYLAYGSALGAVRHQGFIPWDDDIDVVMPRKDYELLYENRDLFGDSFKLSSYRNVKNYPFDFTKIESTSTTLIERINPIYVGGIYIDVFPLDNVPSSQWDAKTVSYLDSIMPLYHRFFYYPRPHKSLIKYLSYLFKRFYIVNCRKILYEWDSKIMEYSNQTTNYLKDYHCSYYSKNIMKKEVFGKGVEMMFEGKLYVVPVDYDSYLRNYYGDYMELPPLEKRCTKHDFLFEDTTRRLSNKELKPIIDNLKSKYYFRCRFKDVFRRIKSIIIFNFF